jgi:tRNA(Ile)-lysidine synthetase-like protein
MNELCSFWFSNPKFWFNSTTENDDFIKSKYSDLIINNTNFNNIVGCIILYDQIARHIYRNNNNLIQYYHKQALKYSLIILPFINCYKPEVRCFILMPIRHTFKINDIKICLNYVKNWMKESNHNIYKRFYFASINALIKINNEKYDLYKIINYNYDKILDIKSTKNILPQFNIDEIKTTNIYQEFSKHVIFNDTIILSISGGVDSMVCSVLLYIFCLEKNIKKYALSINYNNRDDQYIEIDMIAKWLYNLDFELHIRNINEINRDTCIDRDFYEKTTRKIRFDMYKKITNNPYVILGHNKDDSIENIFSNIIKKNNYHNLLGMSYNSKEQDVNIIRPLLDIYKKDIYNFAYKYKIPFVYDSTPKWSQRGMMRDLLIPQINKFDNKILDGLIELSKNFNEIYKVYEKCLPNIIYQKNKCIVEDKEIYFFDYWKNIFTQISKFYNQQNIKNKSIQYFINNVKFEKKITLNKIFIAKKEKNNIIFFINK